MLLLLSYNIRTVDSIKRKKPFSGIIPVNTGRKEVTLAESTFIKRQNS